MAEIGATTNPLDWPIDVFREYADRAFDMECVRFRIDQKELLKQRITEAGQLGILREKLRRRGVPAIL